MKWYFIVALFGTLLATHYIYFTPQANKSVAAQTQLETLHEDYEKKHEQVMAGIRTEFKIPQQMWDHYMNKFLTSVAKDDLLTSKKAAPSTKLIARILQEHGINPARVIIKKLKDPEQAEAVQDIENNGRIIHRLGINDTWLQARPLHEQEAILRHEMQHLLNYDSLEDLYIRWILTDMGYTKEDWENTPSMTAYHHFRELRADALACAKSKKVAQSLHDYLCNTMHENEDDFHWYTHPRDSVRAHQLACLYNLDSNFATLA